MEFEMSCIDRMRKMLFDLSMRLEVTLKDTDLTTKETEHDEVWAKDLVSHLEMINDVVNRRMKIKPLEKLASANYRQECLMRVVEARSQVQVIKVTLEKERTKHEEIAGAISAEIAQKNSFLDDIKKRHAEGLIEKLKESDNEIGKIREEHEATAQLLQAEIKSKEIYLDTLKAMNAKNENLLYRSRTEVEAAYLEVLSKYDTNVGALHRTMENLTDELNRLDEKLKAFRNELAIQDVQYVELKTERELAILKAFAEDLEDFERKRAAKIIQKAWRSYHERCFMRKKKKSKKKK